LLIDNNSSSVKSHISPLVPSEIVDNSGFVFLFCKFRSLSEINYDWSYDYADPKNTIGSNSAVANV